MNNVRSYLEIIVNIEESNREVATKIYSDYRQPYVGTVEGALTKDLLVRNDDVQVLYGFDSSQLAESYLEGDLLKEDVFVGLKELW